MSKPVEQMIAQVVVSLTLVFLGHYLGQNMLLSVGFGSIIGLMVRNSK
jgi:branched-subunit amino acid transport protein AzlD